MSERISVENAYEAAHQSILTVHHGVPGVIEIRGADRLDLLHRLSTNDLEGIPPDRVMRTVFTDPVGRTIDAVTVLTLSEELLLVTSSGKSQIMRDWLERHIFFQDDVTMHVADEEWTLNGVYGPDAVSVLQSAIPSAGALISSEHGIHWPIDRPVAGFLRLVRPDQNADDWVPDPGATAAFDILRVEAGRPEMGAEIQEDSIPLEVGLWDAVSFDKGCYVGQEIIARMESRGKLAKQLVGVRLESRLEPGSTFKQDERIVATLTSVVQSPRLGWIGLASGRPSAISTDGGRVQASDSGEAAYLVELPFADREVPTPA